MKAPQVSIDGTGVLALVAVAVLGLVVWKGLPKLGQAAAAAGQAVNPLNPDNVFASGVNAVGGAIVTDPAGPGKNADGSWSLGGWVYDVLNPDTAQAVQDMSQPVFTGGATGSW